MACAASEPVQGRWRVSSPYGMRSLRGRAPRHHEGWDITAERGRPILAVLRGKVLHAFEVGTRGFRGYGNGVVLEHVPDRLYSISAHMNAAPWVRAGDEIEAGTQLGPMGDSDAPGAVHLHLAFATKRWPKHYAEGGLDPAAVFAQLGLTLHDRRPVIEPGSLISCERGYDAEPLPPRQPTMPPRQHVPPPDLSRFWESPGTPSVLDRQAPAFGAAGLALALGLALAAGLRR